MDLIMFIRQSSTSEFVHLKDPKAFLDECGLPTKFFDGGMAIGHT
jgi:hypothetical protein